MSLEGSMDERRPLHKSPGASHRIWSYNCQKERQVEQLETIEPVRLNSIN